MDMGDAIQNAAFDCVFVMFYNNPTCSASGGIEAVNFDEWHNNLQDTASKDTKLFLGLVAPGAANDPYSLRPKDLKEFINEFKGHAGFGGSWCTMLRMRRRGPNTMAARIRSRFASVLATGNTCGLQVNL
ncbi:MAG: Glycoside hydrolase 18 protein [Alyxoria varia]|nr:MAG: Glycoside hydrolase 18 protein [Alyxoria varia]